MQFEVFYLPVCSHSTEAFQRDGWILKDRKGEIAISLPVLKLFFGSFLSIQK